MADQTAFYEHAKATTAALANGPITLTGMVGIVEGLAQLWELDHGVTLDFSAMSLAKACHMGIPEQFRA